MRTPYLCITTIAAVIVVAFLGANSTVCAQELAAAIEKLDQLEAQLNRSTTAKEADLSKKSDFLDRDAEVELLLDQIARNSTESFSLVVTSLLDRLHVLEQQLATTTSSQRQHMQELRSQVSRIEPQEHITSLGNSVTALQSQVEGLTAQMVATTQRLDGLATISQQPVSVPPVDVGELASSLSELRTVLETAAESIQQEEVDSAIEISGMGGVRQSSTPDEGLHLGPVEVGLTATLDAPVVVATAIAYDAAAEAFGLGPFIMDFRLLGSDGEHITASTDISTSGLIVGKFDVPFGIDWQVYPAVVRKLVSAPLAVEHTHGFWHDYGVQAYLETEKISAIVYSTNGFGYEDIDAQGQLTEVDTRVAFGGRADFRLHRALKVGGSYASFLTATDTFGMDLIGVDAQLQYEGVTLKGEYLVRRTGLTGESQQRRSGFYVQGAYTFGPTFIVGRHGRYSSGNGETNLQRTSLGLGWVPFKACGLRLEYQINTEEDNSAFLQLTAGF